MNDKDMTLDTFRYLVLEGTSYAITDAEIEEFYEDGYDVDDTLEWCEWKLDSELFSEF